MVATDPTSRFLDLTIQESRTSRRRIDSSLPAACQRGTPRRLVERELGRRTVVFLASPAPRNQSPASGGPGSNRQARHRLPITDPIAHPVERPRSSRRSPNFLRPLSKAAKFLHGKSLFGVLDDGPHPARRGGEPHAKLEVKPPPRPLGRGPRHVDHLFGGPDSIRAVRGRVSLHPASRNRSSSSSSRFTSCAVKQLAVRSSRRLEKMALVWVADAPPRRRPRPGVCVLGKMQSVVLRGKLVSEAAGGDAATESPGGDAGSDGQALAWRGREGIMGNTRL